MVEWEKYAALARKVAAEGAVLLKNDKNVLPLKSASKVSVFGRIQFNYYKSGTGSGGMRDCGTYAFSMPNGTCLACTFDEKLLEELGDGTLESLRQLPYEAFVHGQCDEYAEKTGACCVPVEDGVILKNMNQVLLNEPDVNVPMIVGNNRDEGLPAASMEVKLAGYEEKDRRYIEGFYVAGKQDDIESMKKQAVALSNEEWYARVIYWARIRERALGMPTWQYQFCRSAEINGFPIDAGVPQWIRKGEDAEKHLYIDEKIEMTDDVYDERVNAELRLMERIYGIKILD